MQPQMPPNPFLGAARGMMQPPLPPVCLYNPFFNMIDVSYFCFVFLIISLE